MSIGIKFPFKETDQGGVFMYTKTSEEAIRTNLISLLTTKRKQRVMNNNLYSPLYDQLFEQWDEIAQDKLDTELQNVISSYIPEITVQKINFNFEEIDNLLTVKIIYTINFIGNLQDSVEISVNL